MILYVAGTRHCFVLKSVETGTRAYTALSSAGTRGLFQEVKQLRHEADYSPHLVLRLRMYVAIPPLFHMLALHAEGQLHFYICILIEKTAVTVERIGQLSFFLIFFFIKHVLSRKKILYKNNFMTWDSVHIQGQLSVTLLEMALKAEANFMI